MKQLTLKYLLHREQKNIALHFDKDAAFIQCLRKCIELKWSRQNTCWYCLCTKANFEHIKKIALENKYAVEDSQLRQAMKKTKSPTAVHPGDSIIKEKQIDNNIYNTPNENVALSKINAGEMEKFKQQLILKSYSPSTIRTYTNEFMQLLKTLKTTPPYKLQSDRIKDYLQYCHEKLKLSEATLHSRMNALKFYYEQVLGKEKFFWEIPRPKKRDQLPKVLGENEIGRMFNAIGNIKHKAILFTAYSAGLRVSEVINLKIKDVDSERMQLFIEKSKGKKDRYVGLSILLLDVLRAYLKKNKPMPEKYVFENPNKPGEPYSIRSAQKIFQNAKEKALINKTVGIHSLRHSFATHLLEKGIDIRYIKDLLGHFSIKTTEKYLHVKKETLINIPNVLDELNKTFTLQW